MDTAQDNNYMKNDLASKHEQLFAGQAVSHKIEGQKIVIHCDNDAELFIHVISDRVIRFRYNTEGYFDNDFSYAIDNTNFEATEEFSFREKDDHYRITTDRLICTITKQNLRVRILDRSGNVLCEDEKGFHWEYSRDFGGDIVMCSKLIHSGEHFYGLGDKSNNLDLRGEKFQLWGSDTYGYGKKSDPLYKNIPFYIGMHKGKSYGIFFDNSFRSFFDFGNERSNVSSFYAHGGEMDYYFIYGPDNLEVVEQYTKLTGTPELPPLWSLGFHQCKWSYYPESKVKEITKGFRDRQIPCDAIYLDIDYMDGFRCFTWDKEKFAEPKRMIDELKADGFKTVVIIDPGIKIDKNYSVWVEGKENDYFCKRADGPLMKGSVWPGLCHFPDFTKPVVRDWWTDLFKGLIAEDGIKGVWNDMNEPAVFEEGTFPDDVRFDYDGNPCSHRKAHNVYGMQMAKATNDGVKKYAFPDRPFTISRSGYAGMQRYSSVWTGDNVASWEHLKIANSQCQRLSVSGISFAGSDIGGFIETPNGELFTRWIQLGIFHPFCRVHSSGDHGDQEPWSFGDEYTPIIKKFIEFRYQLLPYIYSTFYQYISKGTPMLRPIAVIDMKDSETFHRQAEFALGDNLLICPIAEEKADGRWMYLPEGKWYYWWTDQLEQGKDEVWADADLNRIPLWVKAGAVLPLYPVMQYVGEKKVNELTLHVYYTEDEVTSTLYEDAGDGYGYENNEKCVKTFTVSGDASSLSINQIFEGAYEAEYSSLKVIVHGLPFTPSTITADTEAQKFASQEGNVFDTYTLTTQKVKFEKIEISK